MSELSNSFHIRTSDAPATEKLLASAKLSGLVFGPKNGWLTFVPYADEDAGMDVMTGFATKLAEVTNSLVLQYAYAEDHFWSFSIARSGQPPSMFSCSWDPKLEVVRDQVHLELLEGIASPERVEPFLAAQVRDATGQPLAHGFAEALGLPAYRWLSPELVKRDTQLFLSHGARRLGRKQPTAEKRLKLPPMVEIDTPKADLSAREAMELLKPMTAFLDPSWTLYELHGHAHSEIDPSASTVPSSDWQFRYVNPKTRDVIYAQLFSTEKGGKVTFRAMDKLQPAEEISLEKVRAMIAQFAGDPLMEGVVRDLERSLNEPTQAPKFELPPNWLNSTIIAGMVAALEPPQEVPTPGASLFSLSWGRWPEARWRVLRGYNRKHWSIEIDAVSGMMLRQTIGWADENDYMIKPRRERIKGGPWHDM